jgi:hypothetical protein
MLPNNDLSIKVYSGPLEAAGLLKLPKQSGDILIHSGGFSSYAHPLKSLKEVVDWVLSNDFKAYVLTITGMDTIFSGELSPFEKTEIQEYMSSILKKTEEKNFQFLIAVPVKVFGIKIGHMMHYDREVMNAYNKTNPFGKLPDELKGIWTTTIDKNKLDICLSTMGIRKGQVSRVPTCLYNFLETSVNPPKVFISKNNYQYSPADLEVLKGTIIYNPEGKGDEIIFNKKKEEITICQV